MRVCTCVRACVCVCACVRACAAKTLLHQMGEVVVLDMITNNFDRLPFIWTNFGNMENIMVRLCCEL